MATARPPAASETSGQLSFQRLGIALAAVALCLAGGGALGYYCDTLNRAYRQKHDPADTPTAAAAGAGGAGAAATPPAARTPKQQEEQAAVNAAVLRGVRYLKTTQSANGAWPSGAHHVGYAALPGLTLLECGVPPSDPTVQKAAAYVRAQSTNLAGTYELSLAVLFLDRLGEERDRERIQTLALRLVAGQTATGGWGYTCPHLSPAAHKQLFLLLKDNEAKKDGRLGKLSGATTLLPEVRSLPILQDLAALKPAAFESFGGDNSNTQFGILALWVARRHEVPLERTAYLVVQRFRHSQNPNGKWEYTPRHTISPATTCTGLLGLAIGLGVTLEKGDEGTRPQDDPHVKKGLHFLGTAVGRLEARPQNVSLPNLYVLWSLERVAVLFGLDTIDGKDWYAWARQSLLTHQQPRGNWQGGAYPGTSPTIDTCFALLTLLKANLAKDLTTKMQLLGRSR